MPASIRQLVVLLLVTAQVAIGSSAGGIVCSGAGAPGEAPAAAGCSHAGEHEGLRLPAPVEPHDDNEHDCPCIDAEAPVARASDERGDGDLAAQAVLLSPQAAPLGLAPLPVRAVDLRPPGPAPGLRTMRLNI